MRQIPVLLAFALAACSGGSESASNETVAPLNTESAANVLAPFNPPAPGEPGGLANDTTPVSEAPFTAESAQGAANIVQTYYALIEQGRYRDAWALWSDDGKASGTDAAGFAASFGDYSEYHANVGAPGQIEAGAGQRYVSVPVQVYGRLKADGKPFNRLGEVTLHRAGDIDGASEEQRQWRIRAIKFNDNPGAPAH
ncbi:hypothetical protein ACX40Y_02185 [Sphingomonas sp. RS6]